MRRREFIGLVGGAAVGWPLNARAQQSPKPVIGFLSSASAGNIAAQLAGIRLGLAEIGYVEGQNLSIEYRWAEGVYDRLPTLVAELVDHRVEVIVTQAPPAARAARKATTVIPIVFAVGTDPVAEGLVASLARPGGNITGVTLLSADLMAKRLALIHEIVPKARLIALLVNPRNPNNWINEAQQTARTKGLTLQILNAETIGEIDAAFATIVEQRAGALILGEDTFLSQRREQIATLASRHGVPTISFLRGFVEVGGLMSYGAILQAAYREVGLYTGQILKGAKPADLPVRQPTKFEMVVNLKTAMALGLTISPLLLARADEVIE